MSIAGDTQPRVPGFNSYSETVLSVRKAGITIPVVNTGAGAGPLSTSSLVNISSATTITSGNGSTFIQPNQPGPIGGNIVIGSGETNRIGNVLLLGTNSSNSNYNVSIGYNTAAGQLANANSGNAVAIGWQTTAHSRSIAFGWNANANSYGSVSIGHSGSAGGQESVSIGASAGSSGTSSVALGASASAGGSNAVAIRGTATPADSIAIRGTVNTGATNGIALGVSSSIAASVTNSIAIGNTAVVNTGANSSVAIGNGATIATSATPAVAIGNSASAGGTNTVAILGTATPNGSIAIRGTVNTGATNSIAIGSSSSVTASATDSIAIGPFANGRAPFALSIGSASVAVNIGSTVISPVGAFDEFPGQVVFGAGSPSAGFFPTVGVFPMWTQTTTNTPAELGTFNNSGGRTPGGRMTVGVTAKIMILDVDVIARDMNNTALSVAAWNIKFAFSKNSPAGGGAATSEISPISKTILYSRGTTTGWDVTASADTTNGRPAITVTGAASTTIGWTANVKYAYL